MKPIAYRIPDALTVSGIGRTKMFELIKDGEIESVHVGRRTLIVAASLEHFIERLRLAEAIGPIATDGEVRRPTTR